MDHSDKTKEREIKVSKQALSKDWWKDGVPMALIPLEENFLMMWYAGSMASELLKSRKSSMGMSWSEMSCKLEKGAKQSV